MTKLTDLRLTCAACRRTFTLNGPVDTDVLNAEWFWCPWCGKVLELRTTTNPQPGKETDS